MTAPGPTEAAELGAPQARVARIGGRHPPPQAGPAVCSAPPRDPWPAGAQRGVPARPLSRAAILTSARHLPSVGFNVRMLHP